jgi:hypothetical protein
VKTVAPRRLVILAGVVASLASESGFAATPGWHPVEITTRPIVSFELSSPEQRFGALEFRGGLEIRSPDRQFGSLSGLDFSTDGRTLYAISDTGHWFAARPQEKDGGLVGLADTRMAPVLNSGGVPLSGKRWSDAEGLRIVRRGDHDAALVSFEQVNDLRLFDGTDFVLAASRSVDVPASVKTIDPNRGLEALAIAPPAGPLGAATVLIAEHTLDSHHNHRGWIVGGPRDGTFSLVRSGDYDVTDAAFLPDGDLLVLERSLEIPFGLGMRIRRIAEADLVPGATVDGDVVIEADLRNQIDNMEGMAIRTNDAGETILALVSDDNNSPLQRTLLLYFALVQPPRG